MRETDKEAADIKATTKGIVNVHRCEHQSSTLVACVRCRVRTAIIYVDFEGTIGCRHCFRALHQSPSENPLNRALAKARKIRGRLAEKQASRSIRMTRRFRLDRS